MSPSTTRERLRREALRLFAERGFRAVTVNEIAAAAGVSHMTFFRHFPTKESVVVDDPYDPLVAAAVVETDRNLPPLERVRVGLLTAWTAAADQLGEETRIRIGLVAGEPSLRAAMWEANDRTLRAIVDALVGDGVDRSVALAAAGAGLGALTVTLLDWGSGGQPGPVAGALRLALESLGSPRSAPPGPRGDGADR